jgi:cytoskeletal protein CcmA (bactofilin family)
MTTFIATQMLIQGSLHTSKPIKVAGRIEGQLTCDESIHIDAGGFVKGSIVADEVIVQGFCEGIIHCNHLVIRAGGHFKGDVCSRFLSVEAKALFEGTRRMQSDDSDNAKNARKPIEPFETDTILL